MRFSDQTYTSLPCHLLQPVNEDGYATDEVAKIKPPSKQQIIDWVEQAWYETKTEVVKKSFLCTGIANACNGCGIIKGIQVEKFFPAFLPVRFGLYKWQFLKGKIERSGLPYYSLGRI